MDTTTTPNRASRLLTPDSTGSSLSQDDIVAPLSQQPILDGHVATGPSREPHATHQSTLPTPDELHPTLPTLCSPHLIPTTSHHPTPATSAQPTPAHGQHFALGYFQSHPFGPALGLLPPAEIDTEVTQHTQASKQTPSSVPSAIDTQHHGHHSDYASSPSPTADSNQTGGPVTSTSTDNSTAEAKPDINNTSKQRGKPVLLPEDRHGKDIVDRTFARFGKSKGGKGGIILEGKIYWHFDDATRPSAGAWPPALVDQLLTFYVTNGKGRGKKGTQVSYKSLLLFWRNLRRFYNDNKWAPMEPATVKAGSRALNRLKRKCGERPQPVSLDMESIFELSKAIWSPEYVATFRQRVDMALYISLVLGTGTKSDMLLAAESQPYDPDYARTNNKDGVRWSDFKLFMTSSGPLCSLTRRIGSPRVYCINAGPIIGLSAGELVSIGMALDNVIADDVSLEYLLSPRFWGNGNADHREVVIKPNRSPIPVFRDYKTQSPLRRSDINRELERLSSIARLGVVVTTGSLRRFVSEKVYAEHGFEVCNALMDHKTLPKTRKYLEKTMEHQIEQTEVDAVGARIQPHLRSAWQKMPRHKRAEEMRREASYILPHTWVDPFTPQSPTPPTPSPPPKADADRTNILLANLAAWMACSRVYFRQHVEIVRPLARWQLFESVPRNDAEHQHETAVFIAKYKEVQEDPMWDEECIDTDDDELGGDTGL